MQERQKGFVLLSALLLLSLASSIVLWQLEQLHSFDKLLSQEYHSIQ